MWVAPQPAAAWPLSGSSSAAYGGAPATLHGACSWHTTGKNASSSTVATLTASGRGTSSHLVLDSGSCFASAVHAPSLLLGAGSFSVCVRFCTTARGAPLLAKLDARRGFGIEARPPVTGRRRHSHWARSHNLPSSICHHRSWRTGARALRRGARCLAHL